MFLKFLIFLTLTVMSSFRLSASFRSCSISPMATVVRHGHPQIQTGSEVSSAKRMLGENSPENEYTFPCYINQCNLFHCLWQELIIFAFTVIYLQFPCSTSICNSNRLRPGLQILTNKDACKISLVTTPQTYKCVMSQSQIRNYFIKHPYTCFYIVGY